MSIYPKINVMLVFASLLVIVNQARAHKEWVHQQMVIDAYRLLKAQTNIHRISPLFDSFFTYEIRVPSHRTICSLTDAAYAEDLNLKPA
jgi:hypothetical protein